MTQKKRSKKYVGWRKRPTLPVIFFSIKKNIGALLTPNSTQPPSPENDTYDNIPQKTIHVVLYLRFR